MQTVTADLAEVLDLEFTAWQGQNCLAISADPARAKISLEADRERLYTALERLSLEELKAYRDYRRANKWW